MKNKEDISIQYDKIKQCDVCDMSAAILWKSFLLLKKLLQHNSIKNIIFLSPDLDLIRSIWLSKSNQLEENYKILSYTYNQFLFASIHNDNYFHYISFLSEAMNNHNVDQACLKFGITSPADSVLVGVGLPPDHIFSNDKKYYSILFLNLFRSSILRSFSNLRRKIFIEFNKANLFLGEPVGFVEVGLDNNEFDILLESTNQFHKINLFRISLSYKLSEENILPRLYSNLEFLFPEGVNEINNELTNLKAREKIIQKLMSMRDIKCDNAEDFKSRSFNYPNNVNFSEACCYTSKSKCAQNVLNTILNNPVIYDLKDLEITQQDLFIDRDHYILNL